MPNLSSFEKHLRDSFFKKKLNDYNIEWNNNKKWAIVILANAHSDSKAVEFVIKNFHIMDRISDDVNFYMPGYSMSWDKAGLFQSDAGLNNDLDEVYGDFHASDDGRYKVVESPRLGSIYFSDADYADFVMEITRKVNGYHYSGACELILLPVNKGMANYDASKVYNLDAIIECHCGNSLDYFLNSLFNIIRGQGLNNTDNPLYINAVIELIKKLLHGNKTSCFSPEHMVYNWLLDANMREEGEGLNMLIDSVCSPQSIKAIELPKISIGDSLAVINAEIDRYTNSFLYDDKIEFLKNKKVALLNEEVGKILSGENGINNAMFFLESLLRNIERYIYEKEKEVTALNVTLLHASFDLDMKKSAYEEYMRRPLFFRLLNKKQYETNEQIPLDEVYNAANEVVRIQIEIKRREVAKNIFLFIIKNIMSLRQKLNKLVMDLEAFMVECTDILLSRGFLSDGMLEEDVEKISVSDFTQSLGEPLFEVKFTDLINYTSSIEYHSGTDDVIIRLAEKLYKESVMPRFVEDRYEIVINQVVTDIERCVHWSLREEFYFISYSTKNTMLAMFLKQEMQKKGKNVWIAPDGIPQGREYSLVIPTTLKMAKTFVLLLTPDSAKSRWVKRELDVAISNEARTKVKVLLAEGYTIEDIRNDNELNFYLNRVQVRYQYADVVNDSLMLTRFLDE